MATGGDVLQMLCPNSAWTIIGDNFDSIIWESGAPEITESEFLAGFDLVDNFKAKKTLENAAAKQAILDRLGITAEEARLLLS
jgi:hypothetical protein